MGVAVHATDRCVMDRHADESKRGVQVEPHKTRCKRSVRANMFSARVG
jgi:hypothetical protein